MMRTLGALRTALLGVVLVGTAVAGTAVVGTAGAQVGAVRGVHDPVIAKADSVYWLFTTGRGITIRRSTDLVHWDSAGRVFAEGLPPWAKAAVPKVEFPWAPDISFFNGRWHLYYSLSSFASQQSVIGLATNATLDPADPRYKWTDEGRVVASVTGVSTFNAIDPNLAYDEQGRPWLNWGSFWGGIKLHRIDPATGKFSMADTTTYSIAARAGVGAGTQATNGPRDRQAIEGPFIIRHGDFFYLFASYDLCCRGVTSTYHVRVGRARTITGPYMDADSVLMTEGGGTVVLAGAGRVRGPGHIAVLADGGRDYLVHHFYDAEAYGIPTLQIRPLVWEADGWPRAGDPLTPPPPAPPRRPQPRPAASAP